MEAIRRSRDDCYLEKVEDALLATLKEGVDGSVKVEAFPADPDRYDFAGLNNAILIHYSGSRFQGREQAASSTQARRMNFAIVLLSRELRGASGSYRILEDIRLAVQGAVFEGAGPVEIVADGLISESSGLWRWEITIGLTAPAVGPEHRRAAPLMRPVTHAAQG